MSLNKLWNQTLAAKAHCDPSLLQGKEMILSAIATQQKNITTIRPPIQERAQSYQELLEEVKSLRGGKLWYPYIGSGLGNGPLVELIDGSVKYDFISGIGVHFWGHSHPEILSTSIDAAVSDIIMQGHLQQNNDAVSLLRLLKKHSDFDHTFLTTSGAMANENALKIAFQKKAPASRVLAFHHCFIGRTLALSQISDKPAYRQGLPQTVSVDYIPFFDPARPEESTQEAAAALKKHLSNHKGEYAVMCMELIQGEGGFNVGDRDFFITIMEILKNEGIAIFVDEVQTFGRTYSLFAYQHFGLEDYVDIVTIGKMSLICATLFKQEYAPKPGLLSQTFTASTTAIRCSQLIIEKLINENFYGKAGKLHTLHHAFRTHLETLVKKYPDKIEGPFGIGAMVVFTPYKGETKKVLALTHRLFEKGVISFVAGPQSNRLRFLIPAGAIDTADIDAVTTILEEALQEE